MRQTDGLEHCTSSGLQIGTQAVIATDLSGLCFSSILTSKVRDQVCLQGRLGACIATCHNVGVRAGPFQVFEAVPFCHCRNKLKPLDWVNKQSGWRPG
jgi:hypothetical protein